MERLRIKMAAWVLVLALALGLSPAANGTVLSDVYFTAVNENLLDLTAETMPFWSGGVLYIPSRIFDSRELGITYARNGSLAMLYTTRIDLRFDLEQQLTYDKQGAEYTGHAVERGGIVFFPLDLVCGYFGLDWSYSRTDTVPLIRVTSSSAILDIASFLDAAAWKMNSVYTAYEKAVQAAETPPETSANTSTTRPTTTTPVTPTHPETNDPPAVQAAPGQKIYLIVESRKTEDTLAVMETLGDVQATFLLTASQMEDGDLLRGLVAGGHAVALKAVGDSEEELTEVLSAARALMWQAACTWLELVWYDGREDISPLLEREGCVRLTAALDRRDRGLSGSTAANTLLRSIGRHQEDLGVYLGSDSGCRRGLNALLTGLETGGFRLSAWRLTA